MGPMRARTLCAVCGGGLARRGGGGGRTLGLPCWGAGGTEWDGGEQEARLFRFPKRASAAAASSQAPAASVDDVSRRQSTHVSNTSLRFLDNYVPGPRHCSPSTLTLPHSPSPSHPSPSHDCLLISPPEQRSHTDHAMAPGPNFKDKLAGHKAVIIGGSRGYPPPLTNMSPHANNLISQ